MSATESSANVPRKCATKRKPALRAPSASEIARNTQHFETWAQGQGLEQVSFSDIPAGPRVYVDIILDVTGKIPLSWIDKKSAAYKRLSAVAEPDFLSFIKTAHRTSPRLFRPDCPDDLASLPGLFRGLCGVFSAWKRLRDMLDSQLKYSESDFAANVYNPIRSPAIEQAVFRTSCALCLPQPRRSRDLSQASARVLKTRIVMPDCTVFAGPSLHGSTNACYKRMNRLDAVKRTGTATRRSSFRYQATPVNSPPEPPGFEFASSVWEDKKPAHQGSADAYRQNRMSAAALLRHLHSAGVDAPIVGLVFASATVRAHVDWWEEDMNEVCICSAPYPGVEAINDKGRLSPGNVEDNQFYSWDLGEPASILEVYFLIRNIDAWTAGGFHDLVRESVDAHAQGIQAGAIKYTPWRRVDDTWFKSALAKENISHSSASSGGRRSLGARMPVQLKPKKSKR